MQFKNSHNSYGFIAIFLHWSMAIALIGLFALGFWMVDLDYYSNWYHQAPWIHKSIGVIVIAVLLFRLFWKTVNIEPTALDKPLLNKIAHAVHHSFYLLIFIIGLSGYLISTAEGDAISVFDWFEIPALITPFEGQADIAGLVHEYLAYLFIALVVLHALAALKHHFVEGKSTLKRMLWPIKDDSI